MDQSVVGNRQLEVIAGCMFSGKTEELIRRLKRVGIARWPVLLFKPTIDDRYSTNTTQTHDGLKFPAILLEPGKEMLEEVGRLAGHSAARGAMVVAFDEAQFFSDKLPALCEALVGRGKKVMVAGLNLDFAGKPFGPMPLIMALADEVTSMTAICVKCGGAATRTQRLVEGKPAPVDGPTIQIGGQESYEARCRDCWERG